MIDLTFIIFAFFAGMVAFFAPCSIVLLPGYIAYYISKGESSELNNLQKLVKGLNFGLITIAGFFTVYGIFGLLIILLGQFIKKFIPSITIFFGISLVIIGFSMLLGKKFSINFNFRFNNEKNSLYFFGIAYAISSLGCVFPIFLTIILQSIVEKNIILIISPLITYILGISSLMIIVTLLVIYSRSFVNNRIKKVLPYINYLSALILIIAGIYMIYYQYLLFI
ncbi:MAG: cytochrome c biogenesis protein CcdA [Nanoarchaeota archaeon]